MMIKKVVYRIDTRLFLEPSFFCSGILHHFGGFFHYFLHWHILLYRRRGFGPVKGKTIVIVLNDGTGVGILCVYNCVHRIHIAIVYRHTGIGGEGAGDSLIVPAGVIQLLPTGVGRITMGIEVVG